MTGGTSVLHYFEVVMTFAHQSFNGLGSGQITVSSNSTASPLFRGRPIAMSVSGSQEELVSIDFCESVWLIEMRRGLAFSATGIVTESTPFS